MPEFIDYVFQLSVPRKSRAVETIVEDELSDTLERLSELLDGREFELRLEKMAMPKIPKPRRAAASKDQR